MLIIKVVDKDKAKKKTSLIKYLAISNHVHQILFSFII